MRSLPAGFRWLPGTCVLLVAAAGCGADAQTDETTMQTSSAAATASLTAVPPAAPCPPPGASENYTIDWADFVIVDGVSFHAAYGPEVIVPASAVGDVVATVNCRIADVVGTGHEQREGDAAYLPAGTELRAVDGYRTNFRLAALERGEWRVYEPFTIDGAATGEDLLDLRGKVKAVHHVGGERDEDILRTVQDPADVARVVDAVLATPTLRSPWSSQEEAALLRFDMTDGTTVQREWQVESGVLAGQLKAPTLLTELLQPSS